MNIKTGNPSSESASFTRFVLPFAYKICDKSSETSLKWEECEEIETGKMDIDWRKQYFTSEVAKVLFEKAKWYLLKEGSDVYARSFQIKRDKKVISVQINSPQLVLFQKESVSQFLNTGFLILEIYFVKEDKITLDDFLLINETLRYKEQIFKGHRKMVCSLFASPVEVRKLLPKSESNKIKHYFDYWHYLLQQPIIIKVENGVELRQIIVSSDKNSIQRLRPKKDKQNWDIYADARAFVWTCVVLPNGAVNLSSNFGKFLPDEEKWQAHNYGHWIKLLNVDKPGDTPQATHQETSSFEKDWTKERTYHRWEEKIKYPSNYYGFSYHSGAALITDCPNPPFWKHWRTMYFDMVLLLFYVRVTLFRFSDELTKISTDTLVDETRENKIEKWSEKFNKLRWEFTLFTNLYQYPLISNQQQGLEMYELARKCLDLNELFKEIQEEIHNGQEFIEQRRQEKQNIQIFNLTLIAGIGLVLSIALAFFGTEFDEKIKSLWKGYTENLSFDQTVFLDLGIFIIFIFLALGLLIIPFKIIQNYLNKNKKKDNG
jgi:hypothetical protein